MDRRLTTILAADMVGYSRLMAADEEGVIARLRAARAEAIDPAIAAVGGRIVKTMGDGLLVEFASPVAAVKTAIEVQNAMLAREADRPEADRFRFRIGVNTGEIVIDGDDVLGDCVNIAARLESLAPPGGICIGRTTRDQIKGRVNAPLTALGPQPVKNIPEPVEVWRVEIAGVKAPPLAKRAERPSIAVLPFDNMSADPDQEFLADGIVEDVITELSRFRSLLVIARNSTFAYKGAHKDVRQIARELDVRYVVEGSVRRAGERLRVTAQLIEAETGTHIWAERYDRAVSDLFEVQDELTGAIVTAVAPEIDERERARVRRKPTDDLTAWELHQRAQGEYFKFTAEGIAAAKALALRAAEADPEMAAPCVLLARINASEYLGRRTADPAGNLRAAREWADRALACDRRSDDAHFALGFVMAIGGRAREGVEMLERGVALNPNNATLRAHLAMTMMMPGIERAEEALEHAEAALRLNPADPFAWTFRSILAVAHIQLGRLEAGPELLEAVRDAPNLDWKPHLAAALCEAEMGRDEAARAVVAEALARFPATTLAHAQAGLPALFGLPRFAEAIRKLVALGLPEGG